MRAPEQLSGPVVVRERWAWPRIVTSAALAVVALVVPGTAALVLRPENPGEGYVALGLAALALSWLGRRAAVSAVEVSATGIRRLGRRSAVLHWAEVEDVHWHTDQVAGPNTGSGGAPVALHRLRATVGGRPVGLTRYPARDGDADRFTRRLVDLGVDVTSPAWSAVRRSR